MQTRRLILNLRRRKNRVRAAFWDRTNYSLNLQLQEPIPDSLQLYAHTKVNPE